MSSDGPLHVQVAEALGWRGVRRKDTFSAMEMIESDLWVGTPPNDAHWTLNAIPHYDTSWKHTGPLIERHSINISRNSRLGSGPAWRAVWDDDSSFNVVADSPLEAACYLILALHAAGRLDA